MGQLIGHAIPGTFFIVFGIWWMLCAMGKFLRKDRSEHRRQNSTSYYSPFVYRTGSGRPIPVEGYVKLFFCTAGVLVEMIGGNFTFMIYHGSYINLNVWDHILMYVFFGFHSLMDIFTGLKYNVPKNSSLAFLTLAYFVESLLFLFHLHNRSMLDVRMHTLLLITSGLCTIVTALEVFNRDRVVLPIGRSLMTIVQGTWFWQVGASLYDPAGKHFKEDDPEEMEFVTILFGWHLAGGCMLTVVLYVTTLTWLKHRKLIKLSGSEDGAEMGMKLLDGQNEI